MRKNDSLKILLILTFIFFTGLTQNVLANNDIKPEITSTNNLLQKYENKEKVNLHIELSRLYLKNQQWELLLEHINSIYDTCPKLKASKIGINKSSNNNESCKYNTPIDTKTLKKLKKLKIYNIETQQDILDFLDILQIVANDKCQNSNNNKISD